jgi:GNAT superfamily N-acetyltransferase
VTLEVRHEPPDGAAARALYAEYMALVRERLPGFEPTEDIFATEGAFRGPGAAWIVMYEDGAPVACGGLRTLAPGTGEIKRMFVRADARRRGLGRRLLAELETLARGAGHRRVRLLTTDVLTEALDLYRSAGYTLASTRERDGRRDHWLEKELASVASPGCPSSFAPPATSSSATRRSATPPIPPCCS